jgi:hypothetical protein
MRLALEIIEEAHRALLLHPGSLYTLLLAESWREHSYPKFLFEMGRFKLLANI